MDSDIKYRIFNDSLIFESCPSVLTKEMLDEICAYNYKKIVLCEGIEEIGDRAFIDCSALEDIELPSSLKRIGKEAFRECCELREIAIPENVREISDLCFYKCHCLENVSLPNNLLSIGNKAFENSQLISIMIPDSVLSIGNEAFSGCYRLRSIYFSRNL